MSVLQLTDDTFRLTVETTPLLVIEFMPGGAGDGVRHPLAERFPAVAFARVDPSTAPGAAGMFGLAAEAAALIFRDQIVLYLERGEHGAERLSTLLTQVCALDMDQVRAALEHEKQAEVALRMRRVCPATRRGPLGES